MIKKESRNAMRVERHKRVRKDVHGTSAVPRLNVFRSNSNIFAQIIDDESGTTIVSASSLDKDLKLTNGSNVEAASKVGAKIAEEAKKQILKKLCLIEVDIFIMDVLKLWQKQHVKMV